MAITKDAGRQSRLVAGPLTISYDTVATNDGTVEAVIDVPQNAIVVGGSFTVDTAFDSGTSDSLDIGDGGDDDRYTSSAIDLQATGRTALTLTDYKYTAGDTIDIKYTAAGTAATAGSGRLFVEYVVDGREESSFG